MSLLFVFANPCSSGVFFSWKFSVTPLSTYPISCYAAFFTPTVKLNLTVSLIALCVNAHARTSISQALSKQSFFFLLVADGICLSSIFFRLFVRSLILSHKFISFFGILIVNWVRWSLLPFLFVHLFLHWHESASRISISYSFFPFLFFTSLLFSALPRSCVYGLCVYHNFFSACKWAISLRIWFLFELILRSFGRFPHWKWHGWHGWASETI